MDIRAARSAYYAKKTTTRGGHSMFELRADEAGGVSFRGYASVTDTPYQVFDWLGEYDETIARGAFAKSLQENEDVRLLVNHDGIPLARTKSGTMQLREITNPANDPQERGQTGLWVESELDPKSGIVNDLRSAMDRGDLSEMSFAFQATRQEWNGDYTQRTVNELRMIDVSVVTYPANPATSASLSDDRSDLEMALALIESGRPLEDAHRAAIREAVEQRLALTNVEPVRTFDAEIRRIAIASARLEAARASI